METADSLDVVIAKRLLDHARRDGFTFQRAAPGADGPLVGYRLSDGWLDVAIQQGAGFGGSQAPVVNSWVRTLWVSRPHLVAVGR
jgi:hypothetical protein